MRIIVLKSLHFVALFFFGKDIMAILVKSSGPSHIYPGRFHILLALLSLLGSSTFLLELRPPLLPSRPSFQKLLLKFQSLVMLDPFLLPPHPLLLQSVSLLPLAFLLYRTSTQCMLSMFPLLLLLQLLYFLHCLQPHSLYYSG